MTIEYEALIAILRDCGLPDDDAPPGSALLIRFKPLGHVARSEEYVTPEGRIIALDLDQERNLCAIEIVG